MSTSLGTAYINIEADWDSFNRRTLPATFAFDVAEMQQEATVFAVIRLLTTFLGSDQVVEIRGKVARGEVSDEELGDFLGEILEAIFEEFGLSLGE